MVGLLVGIGWLVTLVGAIMILIQAFKEHILWGIGCILFNPISIVFVILHWDRTKKPFFIYLTGVVLIILGVMAQANIQ